jgi:potassium/hydrogen antiporter
VKEVLVDVVHREHQDLQVRPAAGELGGGLQPGLARHGDVEHREVHVLTRAELDRLDAVLLGSILAATDGAAIFAVLRGSTLRRRLARTLEGEAGSTTRSPCCSWSASASGSRGRTTGSATWPAPSSAIGLVVGVGIGVLGAQGLKRATLPSDGLYPVASVAIAALAFGLADVLHDSGFLAVYLAGLALGSVEFAARESVTTFHDGLAWVAQLVMFLVLGLLVFPGGLDDVLVEGTVLAILAAVVARRLAAGVATAFSGSRPREQLVLGWAGLRGAVPVVLATFPVLAGVPRSEEFFDVVFFAVLLSTLLQGTTFEWLARRLGVTSEEPALPAPT